MFAYLGDKASDVVAISGMHKPARPFDEIPSDGNKHAKSMMHAYDIKEQTSVTTL